MSEKRGEKFGVRNGVPGELPIPPAVDQAVAVKDVAGWETRSLHGR